MSEDFKRTISITIDSSLVAAFDQVASRYGLKRSPFISLLMRRAVENQEAWLGDLTGDAFDQIIQRGDRSAAITRLIDQAIAAEEGETDDS